MIGEKVIFYKEKFKIGQPEKGTVKHFELKSKPFIDGNHHCCLFPLIIKDFDLIEVIRKCGNQA